jgi:GNAT superfamily N-acetyltransferase
MAVIRAAALPEDLDAVRDLFSEYLPWVCRRVMDEYGVVFDAESILAHDLAAASDFMPPNGLTLLVYDGADLAGCASMRQLGDRVAELKRMYVRPAFRRQGIGRLLVAQTIRAASEAGCVRMKLDSARFMHEAHSLYRSCGFVETTPYAGSEIPLEHSQHWVFMELDLETGRTG